MGNVLTTFKSFTSSRPLKIVMIFTHRHAYDGQSVRAFPSGGTEKTVVFLSEAFERQGHHLTRVTTLTELNRFEQEMQQETGPSQRFDVLITQEARLFDSPWVEKMPQLKKIWWCHHYPDQPVIKRNAAYGRVFADAIVTLSQTQQDAFLRDLKLKTVTIPHGVWKHELVGQNSGQSHVKKNPFQLVYASTPFRGLDLAGEIYACALEKEPRLQWQIASSMKTYGDVNGDAAYQSLFQRLNGLQGVTLLGALNQHHLYAVYAQSAGFFYPCIWPETYCLALDEALAHGCLPLVRDEGCLHERVNPVFAQKMTVAEMAEALLIHLDSRPVDSRSVSGLLERSFKCQAVLDWQDVAQIWYHLMNS